MVVGILSVPPMIDPALTPGVGQPGQASLHFLVHVGLTVADEDVRLHAALAEDVPTVENGLWRLFPDGRMETLWKIRSDARWHDGTSVSAGDILFTATMERDRDLPVLPNIGYDSVDSIEAVDTQTVKMTWKRPYIDADSMFASPFPRHLLEQQYVDDKTKLPQLRYWTEEFVGTGPYKLRSWASGSGAVMDANDQYVLGRPKIDQIEVRFVADPTTMAASLLANAVNVTLGKGLSLDQAVQLESRWQEGHVAAAASNSILLYPQLINTNPAVVADVRFRKALMFGADRQELADTIMYGRTIIAQSYFSPSTPDYEDTLDAAVKYPYDPAQAARMIEALGYAKGADGLLRDIQDQVLSIEIRANDEDTNTKTMFAVANQWQRLGVKVEPVVIPPERRSDAAYVTTFPSFLLNRQPSDVTGLRRLHQAQTPLPENGFRGVNYSRYQNAEFSALIDRVYISIIPEERTQVLKQVVHQVTDQLIRMGLFYDVQSTLIANRLHGVPAANNTGGNVWNVHQWTLD
ncbi:MAG TPA: ABC transporter substrate-binding protein [Chloroflexota bacterium]